MIEPWVLITLAAAFFQNLRTALQRQIASSLDATGATLARYLFGFPIAIIYVFVLARVMGWGLPELNPRFFINCLIGGTAQIIATVLLVASFSLRSFAVATTYSKTEVVLTALASLIVLAEPVGGLALIGIMVGFAGVLVLSSHGSENFKQTILYGWRQPAALYGIGAGALFAVSAVCFRGAALALDPSHDVILRAATVLAVTYTGQTVLLIVYLTFREPGRFTAVVKQWRGSSVVGLTAIVGSAGWFTAMAMTNAAYVRAVGQVELLLSFMTSVLIFRERITSIEVVGMLLMVAGILAVVLSA